MRNVQLTLMMLAIESFEMGLNTISEAAMSRGMSNFIFVFYSNAFAIPLLLCCFLFYRIFVLGLIRMENLDLRVSSSRSKSVGTVASIAGALTMTMYKGPPIAFTSTFRELNRYIVRSPESNWTVRGFLPAIAALMLAVFFAFQTSSIRAYPAELMLTLICCTFVTMQACIVSLL